MSQEKSFNIDILLSPLIQLFLHIMDKEVYESIYEAYKDLSNPESEFQKNPGSGIWSPALIHEAPAGANMHHWWKGGLFEHLNEMWEVGKSLYSKTTNIQRLDFDLSDLAIVILIHDLSKGIAFQYIEDDKKKHSSKQIFEYRKGFFDSMGYDNKSAWLLSQYGIKLTEQQYIAFIHAEGGWAAEAKNKKEGNMLSKFMHILDMYSSQILGGKYIVPTRIAVNGKAA